MIHVHKILNGYEDIDTPAAILLNEIIGHNMVWNISTFSYRAENDWNSCPSSVVLSNSVNYFKSKLNEAWNQHPLKFDLVCF